MADIQVYREKLGTFHKDFTTAVTSFEKLVVNVLAKMGEPQFGDPSFPDANAMRMAFADTHGLVAKGATDLRDAANALAVVAEQIREAYDSAEGANGDAMHVLADSLLSPVNDTLSEGAQAMNQGSGSQGSGSQGSGQT